MGLPAAQQHIPLSMGRGPVAAHFAVAVEPISADLSKSVSPDIADRINGAEAELKEAFARNKISKWNAIKVAAAGEQAGGGDCTDLALEALAAYFQHGDTQMRAVGWAIEIGSIASEIYTERFAARKRGGETAEKSHHHARVESLAAKWREKKEPGFHSPEEATNDPVFDPQKEAEQQAFKKFMVPEANDPSALSLFGAKRELEERKSSLSHRFNNLPPGASDILEAANDPDFEQEYRAYASGQGFTTASRARHFSL